MRERTYLVTVVSVVCSVDFTIKSEKLHTKLVRHNLSKHFWFFSRFANLFLSDPRYLSSYFDAQFRPHAARSNEVILLVPNILNPGETLPVPVTYDQLFNFYMDIYSRAFPDDDMQQQQQQQQPQAIDQSGYSMLAQMYCYYFS